MSRRLSREFAMQLIYQMEVQKEDREEQLTLAFELSDIEFSEKDRTYINNVVPGVFEKIDEIDGIVAQHAKGWKLQRISRIDLAILRLCIFEIKYRDDIPLSVSINEAVELAKKYGAEDSGSFINGILSKVEEPLKTCSDETQIAGTNITKRHMDDPPIEERHMDEPLIAETPIADK